MPAKRLDLRFCVYVGLSVAALGLCTHLLHGYQVQRNAGALLDLAHAAKEAGDLTKAADLLGRYLGLAPDNTDALAEYALLLADDRLSTAYQVRVRALFALEKVLYRDPHRHDVRRRAARLALSLQNYPTARDNVEFLLEHAAPDDPELVHLLGRCLEGGRNYKQARAAYERAIRLAPHDLEAYTRLVGVLRRFTADVLRDGEQPPDVVGLADRTIEDMVRANDRAHRAYLLRASYRTTYGADADAALRAAADDVARARQLAPDELDVLLAAADVARKQGDVGGARAHLHRGRVVHPKDWRSYQALARLEAEAGQTDAALDCLRLGLKELPGQTDLRWTLADVLVTADRREEADAALAVLATDGFPAGELDCLRARLLMHQRRWRDAISKLATAYPALAGRADQRDDDLAARLAERAGVLLGECYEQTGDTDRAYAAYSRVVARNGRSVPGRTGMAAARWSQGRLQEALDQYALLLRQPGRPDAAWVAVARLTLLVNLERDEARRNWAEVDAALTMAERLKPLPAAVVLLRADAQAARRDFDGARETLLRAYADPTARPAEVWAGLASLHRLQGRPAEALALLDEAQRLTGDRVELRLARARVYAGRDKAGARAALPGLADGLERFPARERRQLAEGLAVVFAQAGMTDEAKRLWQQLERDLPGDVRCRLALFDLAAFANDTAEMSRWQQEVRGIEGEEGTQWRYLRVRALIGRAQDGDLSGLGEARGLLAAVAAQRPDWSRLPLMEARIHDLDRRPDAALPLYQRAIRLGERDPYALARAFDLLAQRGRLAEANEVARLVPQESLLSQEFQRAVAEVALQAHDQLRAERLAEGAVAAAPTDFRGHLILGRARWAAGRRDGAEQALLRARALAPAEPAALVAFVQFLVAGRQTDRARAEVDVASGQLSGPLAGVTLAHCHELVGRGDRARELYEAALKSAGDNAEVQRAVAAFYVRTGLLPEAQDVLRRLAGHASREPAAWARRALAVIVALGGEPGRLDEALAHLDGAGEDGTTAADADEKVKAQWVRARLLARQNAPRQRREAAGLLDDLIARQVATPEDHFLAGQLHESVGNWPQARARYLGLSALPGGDAPAILVGCARSLLRHGEPDGAAHALRGLERQAPEAAATKEIRARMLHAQNRTADAVALLRECARAAGGGPLTAAAVLEELREFRAAEDLYRSAAAPPAARPDAVLALAHFLVRRQRIADALDLCDRAWQTCPPAAVAETCLRVLGDGPPDSALAGRAAAQIEAAAARAPDQVSLLAALAVARNAQGRFGEAEDLFRRVLQKDPRHATALNNLAWLLAMKGEHGEALALANRAVAVSGPVPDVCDTRAVVYMSSGRRDAVESAIADLELVAADAPSAVAFFHLAQAHLLAGRRDEAKAAWARAQALDLRPGRLHPLERPAYDRVARDLN